LEKSVALTDGFVYNTDVCRIVLGGIEGDHPERRGGLRPACQDQANCI